MSALDALGARVDRRLERGLRRLSTYSEDERLIADLTDALDRVKREAAAEALEDAALTLPLWPEDRMSLRDRAAHIRSKAIS